MNEDRLIDIETKLAHQDQLLVELNDVITQQQASIMKLEQLCAALSERLASISEALPAGAPQDETPPHY